MLLANTTNLLQPKQGFSGYPTFQAQPFSSLPLAHQQIHLHQDVTYPCHEELAHADSCIDEAIVLPFVNTESALVEAKVNLPNKR